MKLNQEANGCLARSRLKAVINEEARKAGTMAPPKRAWATEPPGRASIRNRKTILGLLVS